MPGDDGVGINSFNLVRPDGVPFNPGIAVLKLPKNASPPAQQLVQGIMKITKCSLIILPMEYELMLGEYAQKELEAVHAAIHTILDFQKEKKP